MAKKVNFTFTKIDHDQFEHLSLDSDDYYETEIDGYPVMVHTNKGNVDALFYVGKQFASLCKDFNSDDAVSFSEHDPNWPWEN